MASEPKGTPYLFHPGQLVVTRLAAEAIFHYGANIEDLLYRHLHGDWGEVCDLDGRANNLAVEADGRILSLYSLDQSQSIYIITEADRSYTTVLLREEY